METFANVWLNHLLVCLSEGHLSKGGQHVFGITIRDDEDAKYSQASRQHPGHLETGTIAYFNSSHEFM